MLRHQDLPDLNSWDGQRTIAMALRNPQPPDYTRNRDGTWTYGTFFCSGYGKTKEEAKQNFESTRKK